MTNNQHTHIFKNTMVLAVSRIVERSSTVFLGIFVARLLGASGLGVYSAATVFYGFIYLAAEMGSTNFLVREVAKHPEKAGRYVVHLGVMTAAASLLVMAGAWLLLPHLGYSPEMRMSMQIIVLAIWPGTLRTIQEAVFVATGRVEFITYASAIAAAVNVTVSLVLLKVGYGVVSLVVAFALVQLVQTVSYFVFLHPGIARLEWQFHVSEAVALARDMKEFAGSSFIGGLLTRPEIFILSLSRSEAEVGVYSAALKIVDIWQLIPQTYMTNVFPVLSRSYHHRSSEAQSIFDKSILYLLAVALPLATGMCITARPIVHVVYGAGFDSAILPLRILAWTVPLGSVFAVLWRALAAANRQDAVFWIQVAVAAARLGIGYAVIAAFGVLGAAITVCGSLLFHNLFLGVSLRRQSDTQVRILSLSWRLMTAATVMAAVAYLLNYHLQLWMVVVFSAMVYAFAVLVSGAFSTDDYEVLRWFGRKHMG